MSRLAEFDTADTESRGLLPVGKKIGKPVREQRTGFIFRPMIDIKISNDRHQLELTIPEEELTLVTQPDNLFNEKKEVFLVFTSKERIGRPLINIVRPKLIDRRPSTSSPSPIPPPPPTLTVLAIISRTTRRPLHYDVEEGHITANVSLTEGEINANFHRVNASGTGEQEDHTITANMNNFRVKVDNDNGDIVVASVTDPTERSELNSLFQREEVLESIGLVRFFVDIPNVARRYLTVGDDGRLGTQNEPTNGSDFFIIVE